MKTLEQLKKERQDLIDREFIYEKIPAAQMRPKLQGSAYIDFYDQLITVQSTLEELTRGWYISNVGVNAPSVFNRRDELVYLVEECPNLAAYLKQKETTDDTQT